MISIYNFLLNQLGHTGNIYWNWCTDNLWPNQGYFVDGMQTPWCAEFVTCMLEWTGSKCIYFPNSCAFDYRDIPYEQRHYGQDIHPLDIISFDWDGDSGGDHVGIILEVHDWGCHTIEGNSCEVVCQRDRSWDKILFGIRPEWGDIVTEYDYEEIANRAADKVFERLCRDRGNGMTELAYLVWGAKNRDLETHDVYQIVRDIRSTLGIDDGQMYPTEEAKEHSVAYVDGPICVCEDAAHKYLEKKSEYW